MKRKLKALLFLMLALALITGAASAEKSADGYSEADARKDLMAAQLPPKSLAAGLYHTVGLKKDGTAVAMGYNYFGRCNVKNWSDIVAISAGGYHTVALKKDGTVVAVGYNKDARCNVKNWSDIVAISAGNDHTVGLKKDGTVVAAGSNYCGQCNVTDKWTDIAIFTSDAD